jgi:hypothetical protein
MEFRVLWTATVVLLRAVGHVLDKVDGQHDAATRAAINGWWDRVKADRVANQIFWEFIDEERNNVLKEYRLGYSEGDVSLAADGERFTLDSAIYKPLFHEKFLAEDARDIASDAVEWWQAQLRAIETEVRASR